MEIPRLPNPKATTQGLSLDEATFKTIIRGLNVKVTDQRLLILKSLHKGMGHVTAQEMYEVVRKKDSNIGFATVYRFLKKLANSGYVTEIRMGGLPARYELKSSHHHDHLTCTQCSKVCEFENTEIEELQDSVAKKFGFILSSHILELYGLCPDCQRQLMTSLPENK
jgi:Fur family ferric uptake transcriptional regulator